MSFKYKLAKKKKNPSQPQGDSEWHAIPTITNRLTTRSVCKVVTRNTTTAPTEAESTFNLVCDGIVHELQQGNSVQLGELGWLRLSFGSEGVEDLTQFDAATMMRTPKLVFTPGMVLKDVREKATYTRVTKKPEGEETTMGTTRGIGAAAASRDRDASRSSAHPSSCVKPPGLGPVSSGRGKTASSAPCAATAAALSSMRSTVGSNAPAVEPICRMAILIA